MKNSLLSKGIFALVLISLTSCVGKKKFVELQSNSDKTRVVLRETESSLRECQSTNQLLEAEIAALKKNIVNQDDQSEKRIKILEEELAFQKKNNNNLLDRLTDMSILSKKEAENLEKSLDALQDQNKYVQNLTTSMQRKDSVNLALVTNLKRSLSNINDDDIQIEVKKGVVYVSIADKLLFASGSDQISPNAENVLSKVARVINDHRDIDVMVEGHTDNVPMATSCVVDNWDLSVKRATSIVRKLQANYGVNPARLTAAGRSEYLPKSDNNSINGKQMNRRTEIIITPKLDQFFNLLTPNPTKG